MPKYFFRFVSKENNCFRMEVEDTIGHVDDYDISSKYESLGIYEGFMEVPKPYFVFELLSSLFYNNSCVEDETFTVIFVPNANKWCVKKINVSEIYKHDFINNLEREGFMDVTDLWHPRPIWCKTDAEYLSLPKQTIFVLKGKSPIEVFKKAESLKEEKDCGNR